MSTESIPSGLRIREIETESVVVDGKTVIRPKLDEHGQEIEVSSVAVPQEIEAQGAAAVERHVASVLAAPPAESADPIPDTPTAGADS